MGFIYTASGALCCDFCGHAGGVRKVPCPAGWCQAYAMCAECRKKPAPPERHAHCAEHAARFDARLKHEAAILAAGKLLRCSALSCPEGVHVLFRDQAGACTGFYMDEATYRAIPLRDPATPDDYRKHGELRPAPPSYEYGRTTKQVPAQDFPTDLFGAMTP